MAWRPPTDATTDYEALEAVSASKRTGLEMSGDLKCGLADQLLAGRNSVSCGPATD